MSLSKHDIAKNMGKAVNISPKQAMSILESFLLIIKNKSKKELVKLSTFGSFSVKNTPKRLGRNPKTKDSYIIPEMSKLNFKPSNIIKNKIN